MYNHITIKTQDDTLDFFNVKEFTHDDKLNAYRLLSQNNHYYFFPTATTEVII